MPKSYTYNEAEFSADVLVAMMGEAVLEVPKATLDAAVKARDAGVAEILATYRKSRGIGEFAADDKKDVATKR